jgi:UrcA family protein
MEKYTLKSNLPAIAFALAALTATPAIAQASHTVRVPYGDLNLGTPAGVAALDRRLDRAVERVCGYTEIQNLSGNRQIERCRAETWQSIQDDRQGAIARATGQQDVQRAERGSRGEPQVSLAE